MFSFKESSLKDDEVADMLPPYQFLPIEKTHIAFQLSYSVYSVSIMMPIWSLIICHQLLLLASLDIIGWRKLEFFKILKFRNLSMALNSYDTWAPHRYVEISNDMFGRMIMSS